MGVTSWFASLRAGGVVGLIDSVVTDGGPTSNSRRRRGWFGALMAVAWMSFMIGPVVQSWSDDGPLRGAFATAVLLGYALLVVGSFVVFGRRGRGESVVERPTDPRLWLFLAAMVGCTVALVGLLGPVALPAASFVAVTAIFHMPGRESGYVAVAVALLLLLAPLAIPGLSAMPFWLGLIPLGIWVARQLGLRGERLAELARRQRAELDIVEERNRVARDVHDILGHSLTVITVKTELAQRLIDVDLGRARTELADIERLAREALAGVRDTVGGLREVSLRGELANARTALAAADIAADLPEDAQLPDTPHSQLFGWVLREAITNVIRHSAARHCTVRVTATSIEVADDGRGLGTGQESSSGLTGLRERVRAAGGTLTLSAPKDGGVRVRATVPA
ncbi:sensor histidine kinase [Nocardia sp. NPDC051756]|uniref:sensor histidine kinase n=1 Tax=Nocardia sp. NPDC051756 TaxID=3154751 RepID=UPI003431AC1F